MSRTLLALVLIALTAGISLYFYFDPGGHSFFPRCPFLYLTGFQCPGCGSQRAIHALLHGNIAEAWAKNAMLVASLPFIALLIFTELTRTRHPRLYRKVNSGKVIRAFFVIVIAWWIMRNVI